jgi:indole-3-glycerol phosphate synthase/phosphoribosylanthranilate isomerase/anthranilate synthase/indole-3-glycerol phosphate synthase/phosphoribosylanthranilate isomerase
VIAEIKHRSPSAGLLLPDAPSRVAEIARAYARGGAAALSLVVEQDFFSGDPAWIGSAKAASGLPALMKDFVVDEVQLDLALALGADAVLLIVSALADGELRALHVAARRRGLAVLVEAHDEDEVRRALAAGAEIVGINARDLATFRVDLGLVERLGELLPGGVVRVAESGIQEPEDIERLSRFDAFLVGESLLRADDPTRALRRLRGMGTTEVKICGLTHEEDLEACRSAGVDWIGLNLSPLSKRRISVERAREIAAHARFAKGVVLVFAGNGEREMRDAVDALRPDAVQLTDVPNETASWPARVWQTVRVGTVPLEQALGWPGDALLFDSAGAAGPDPRAVFEGPPPSVCGGGAPGGTGRAFDWSLLDGLPRTRPIVLAGGLTPANVASAVRRVMPDVVDVASGVESAPGVKDSSLVSSFVSEVRSVV